MENLIFHNTVKPKNSNKEMKNKNLQFHSTLGVFYSNLSQTDNLKFFFKSNVQTNFFPTFIVDYWWKNWCIKMTYFWKKLEDWS